ncbi:hypothetical protein ABFS83_13G018700 [Erythranthe nasuta]
MIHHKVTNSKLLVLIVLVVCMEYGFVFSSGDKVIKCIESERGAGVGCSNTTAHVIALRLRYSLQPVGNNNITYSLLELHHLEILDLSYNDFGGTKIPEFIGSMKRFKRLPASLGEFSELEVLDIGFNLLQGTITKSNLTKLHSLKWLDLYSNSLTIQISPDWNPPFQLDVIGLPGSNMGPHFPTWIQTQGNFFLLDLSGNGIAGEVPKWFWGLSPPLKYLNISHNQISGTIPHFISSKLTSIDVSFNNFSGHITLLHPNINTLQLSQNMFSGSISSLCTTVLHKLYLLDLSYNQLTGELPNCWENMYQLTFLNLANNSLSGQIPNTLCSLLRLGVLHMRNNNLSGELPSTLKNCIHLKLIDIGGNKLTGNIPSWIGEFSEGMTYLFLNQNRFYGSIPLEICNLNGIQVLDLLSRNNLSGKIPQCFDNFTTLLNKGTTNRIVLDNIFAPFDDVFYKHFPYHYVDYALVQWKGRPDSEYRKNLRLLKLIDLSSNKLVGDIPETFSSLKGLISLNLSRNSLTGNINPDIRNMEVLEVLDLSSNQLSGTIPISIAELQFLAVLDVANNNLSGKIPSSTQLQSFNASAYAGNPGLCGPPLVSCPRVKFSPHTIDEGKHINGGGFILTRLSFWKEVGISIVFGFIVGFWGVVGSLFVKRSWRIAYYNFWGRIGDWFYVTTIVFFRKLRRA